MKSLLAMLSLVLGLLLVAELWWYLGRERQLIPLPPEASVAETPESVLPPKGAFKLPDEADYEEVLERPLFVDGRRPPSEESMAEEDEPAPEAVPAPKLSLVGVFITPAGSTALVRNDATKETQRVRPGDQFEGWEVSRIEADHLVITNGADQQSIDLRDYSQPEPPPKKAVPRRVGGRIPAASRAARRLPAALTRKK